MLWARQATAQSPPCAPSEWPDETNLVLAAGGFVKGFLPDLQNPSASTSGGKGGTVICETGVPIDTGDGSDGRLTDSITLTSGTYNYTEVTVPWPSGTQTLCITIDGDVTINCQGFFPPTFVACFALISAHLMCASTLAPQLLLSVECKLKRPMV